MFDVYELQTRLANAALPSGFEAPQAKLLAELAEPFSDEVTIDTLGNVVARRKGEGTKIAIPAHMDVLGLLVTEVGKDGFARFDTIGGISPLTLLATPFVFENGRRAAVRAEAAQIEKAKTIEDFNDKRDMYVDIGVIDKETTEKYIRPGMVAKYGTHPTKLAGGRILATPYADDLICCVSLLLALENLKDVKPENDLYFVFTVQEEVGTRGARAAAWHIDPDVCFVADVCDAIDSPSAEFPIGNGLGKGPAIKLRDGGALSHRVIVDHIVDAAEENAIPYQYDPMVYGGTDARAMQHARGTVLSSGVSIPTRDIHSPYEMVSVDDVVNAGRLIAAAAAKKLTL
ncbi:MAG: M20/M25/M40 family metallo-hydrolase [Clostridiales Family XIII bacterium]|jgi:endoglucanase|nr:M20/M25/M40 family metallo-hydrolase [Clostridiales Family XIII bacterium]